jgi:hypothetical protein
LNKGKMPDLGKLPGKIKNNIAELYGNFKIYGDNDFIYKIDNLLVDNFM